MSALVHLPHLTRVNMYLKPTASEFIQARITRSKFGVEFAPAEGIEVCAELISGKEAGAKVAKVTANQRARLSLGQVAPTKYQALVSVNPALNEVATVQAPLILEPKEVSVLNLIITAHKEVDLSEFAWFARVYLFE